MKAFTAIRRNRRLLPDDCIRRRMSCFRLFHPGASHMMWDALLHMQFSGERPFLPVRGKGCAAREIKLKFDSSSVIIKNEEPIKNVMPRLYLRGSEEE